MLYFLSFIHIYLIYISFLFIYLIYSLIHYLFIYYYPLSTSSFCRVPLHSLLYHKCSSNDRIRSKEGNHIVLNFVIDSTIFVCV